jgi:hypothetical protein
MSIVAVRTSDGHTLIGSYGELHARLAAEVTAGRLTPDGLLGQGRTPDGLYFARVRLLPVAPRRRLRRSVVVAGVIAAAAVVGAIGLLAVIAVAWVVAHIVQIAVGMAAAGIFLIWLGSRGGSRRHCPGC